MAAEEIKSIIQNILCLNLAMHQTINITYNTIIAQWNIKTL